jgi:hypothetical protein
MSVDDGVKAAQRPDVSKSVTSLQARGSMGFKSPEAREDPDGGSSCCSFW